MREVDLVGEVFEIYIFISESGEDLLDVLLLLGQEFHLSQLVAIVLSLASEVGSHLGTEFRGVLHLYLGEELVESPRHPHDTQLLEVVALPVLQGVGENGTPSFYLVALVETGEIVDAFVFHRTWFGEAVVDDGWHVALCEGCFQ